MFILSTDAIVLQHYRLVNRGRFAQFSGVKTPLLLSGDTQTMEADEKHLRFLNRLRAVGTTCESLTECSIQLLK